MSTSGVFDPSEAKQKLHAKKRQKSKNRKNRCIVVRFMLDDEDSGDSGEDAEDSEIITISFDDYQPDKKSEKQTPTQSQLGSTPFSYAFKIFNLFYPDLNPEDNPEAFTTLATLMYNFWLDVAQLANELKEEGMDIEMQDYNVVQVRDVETAKEFMKTIVREIRILKTFDQKSDNEYTSTLCWEEKKINGEKKKQIKL